MLISDLNNLETVKGNEVVGGFRDINRDENLSRDIKTSLQSDVKAVVRVDGNVADAQADAGAVGRNTATLSFTDTNVVEGKGSFSSSVSASAANGGRGKKGYK
ncbi:MAG: hypothetical protein SWZ49_19720 [Cyanobacteriota bacterium]|nr:hypothetical protein [Cyanobacteriota bacterium]